MRWAQVTDKGLIRASNEDSLRISPDLGLFAVADGMGGHQAGEIASRMALQVLEQSLREGLQNIKDLGAALSDGIQEANRRVYEQSLYSPELTGMGTTITACLYRGNEIFLAQVGDSRAYLFRDGGIIQLTEDHSLVQELVKRGGITQDEAFSHPKRNVLTRALGIDLSLKVDLFHLQVKKLDRLLLCTDGLTGYLRQEEILHTVSTSADPDIALQNLLAKALQAGGADNVTMILVEF